MDWSKVSPVGGYGHQSRTYVRTFVIIIADVSLWILPGGSCVQGKARQGKSECRMEGIRPPGCKVGCGIRGE